MDVFPSQYQNQASQMSQHAVVSIVCCGITFGLIINLRTLAQVRAHLSHMEKHLNDVQNVLPLTTTLEDHHGHPIQVGRPIRIRLRPSWTPQAVHTKNDIQNIYRFYFQRSTYQSVI
jgi:hypothetical protein